MITPPESEKARFAKTRLLLFYNNLNSCRPSDNAQYYRYYRDNQQHMD